MVDFTRNFLLMILCLLVVRCWLLINVLGQFLSLLDSGAAFNLEIIRDCYEAFALYCFERYLIACLGMFEFGRVLFVLIYFCCSFLDVNNSHLAIHWYCCYHLFSKGGEENTIEFMEKQSLVSCNTPLLEEGYAYGVVEHPFPLNCLLREWYLGPDFYHAVKLGIVQYVCKLFYWNTVFLSSLPFFI